jgi:hypothetical protein
VSTPPAPFPAQARSAGRCKASIAVGADRTGLGTKVERASSGLLDHRPVDAGEALGRDLGQKLLSWLQIRFRPELQRRPLPRAQAHGVGDVVLGNSEVLAEVVLAADDHVAVGMAGVEMIAGQGSIIKKAS